MAGYAQLADDRHVERNAKRSRNFMRNGHTATRQTEHQDVGAVERAQPNRQLSTRVPAIAVELIVAFSVHDLDASPDGGEALGLEIEFQREHHAAVRFQFLRRSMQAVFASTP